MADRGLLAGRASGPLVLLGIPVAVFALVFVASLVYFRLNGGGSSAATAGAPAESTPSGDATELPAASGDGRLVVTLSAETAEPAEGYLTSVALDGSGLRSITKPPAGGLAADGGAAISPDGQTIAFKRATAQPGGSSSPHIYLVDIDGSSLRRLTSGRAAELDPAWSPDGARIAFTREVQNQWDLFMCAPDGSGLTRVTRTLDADEDFPVWSPDGARLAFARYEGGFERGTGDLWLAEADGSGATLLLGGPHDDTSPAWSPDGGRLAFVQDGHVTVVAADGTGARRLTSGKMKETHPSWSPDGSRIVFTRDPGSVLLIDPNGSRLSRIPLDAPAGDATWVPSA